MFSRRLDSFVPSVYHDIVEIDDLISAEDNIMDTARTEMSTAFANNFILTANEAGIVVFESMLGIIANAHTEDIEFRRQRVLNRFSTGSPFTYRFLKQKLNEIIGEGAWSAYVDFSNHTLYVEASAVNQNWYSEIEFTINRIKPCNMVFTNVPYTARSINLNEKIECAYTEWLYRLGSWKLGEFPFYTLTEGGIIKMPDIASVQPALLNDAANFIAEDISYVLINDTVRISDLQLKQVTGNVVSIEYEVKATQTSLITDIKLMRADDTILTQSSVYVPVTQAIVSRHLITVKEGV